MTTPEESPAQGEPAARKPRRSTDTQRYTLKLEWYRPRIEAVHTAIAMVTDPRMSYPVMPPDGTTRLREVLHALELESYLDERDRAAMEEDGTVIKVHLTRRQLDVWEYALGQALGLIETCILDARDNASDRTYDEWVRIQTQVWAAQQDVRTRRSVYDNG